MLPRPGVPPRFVARRWGYLSDSVWIEGAMALTAQGTHTGGRPAADGYPSTRPRSGDARPGGRGPTTPPRPPGPPAHVVLARRRALLRAILFVVATLVAPGSVQFAIGNRRLGTMALSTWATSVVLLLSMAWLGSRRPDMVASLATSSFFLGLLRAVVVVLAAGMVVLIIDSWRLARPLELGQRPRLLLTLGVGVLLLGVAFTGLQTFGALGAQRDLVATMFAGRPAIGSVDGRYNVLVLGGDAGQDREGLRPDSLTVVSVDANTGRTAMIGIPRNLQEAPFPADSPLAAEWPTGYDCGDACTINTIYTWAHENPDVLPDAEDPGLEATRQAAEGVTGLTIPFTVIVDMAGFEQVVDALGGVEMSVGTRVPIGGGTGPIEGYIEPGVQRLDGFHALWFARGREGSSDYERIVRQKCVMAALARQVDPRTALTNFQELAAASTAMIRTDIPTGDVPGLLAVANKARTQPIDSVSLLPPLINPTWPEFEEIHSIVDRLIAGQPVVDPNKSGDGDGSVGNSGSSADAALIGSVPAADQSAPEGSGAASAGTSGASNDEEPGAGSESEAPFICAPV